jgi:hypothetical protein
LVSKAQRYPFLFLLACSIHPTTVSRRLAPHKRHSGKGRQLDHRYNQAVGAARARRRRFPQRPQVELHEQARLAERQTVRFLLCRSSFS